MCKKTLAFLLVAIMVLSFAACGKKNVEKTDDGLVYYLGGDVDKSAFDSPENALNVENIFSTITYTETMLYGRYLLDDFYDDGVKEYAKTAPMAELEYWYPYSDGEMITENLSRLPVCIESGVPNLTSHKIKTDRNYHWAYLTFAKENGNYIDVLCSFTVSGNKITFTPVDYYKELYNEESQVIGIEYQTGKDSLEYTFSLKGPNLTLSQGEDSLTLKSYSFSENATNPDMDGYRAEGSNAFENIDVILGSHIAVYLTDTDGELMYNPTYAPSIKYTENGVLTLAWGEKDADGNDILRCHQFVCIGSGYGFTLIDNENTYHYTESYSSRELLTLSDGLTSAEIIKAGELSVEQLKQVVEKKANLLEDLAAAFSEAGLNVAVNHITGEIALDSTILFGVDESAISEEGKLFLQKFMNIYTSVVFGEKYDDFVSKIMVEGHTDTTGEYERNLALSLARADSVKAYCLSDECGIESSADLQNMMESVGYSYDKPIYDENGEVDMDASRRVSFRFVINLDQQLN